MVQGGSNFFILALITLTTGSSECWVPRTNCQSDYELTKRSIS
jgi:hypothetical protein